MDPRYTQYPHASPGTQPYGQQQAYGQQPHAQYGQQPQYINQQAYPGAQPAHPGYYPNPAAYPPHQQYPPQYGQNFSTKPPQQVAVGTSVSADPIVEVQWLPPTNDLPIVDKWFTGLDKEGKGIVGGLEIAKFLQKSNLPKDSLRSIWSLIDNKNLGYVNKSQFNNIIRLVSISCSPIYMGSPPSLERLQKTLYDKIPLPAAFLLEEKVEVAPIPAPVVIDVPVPLPAASQNHPLPGQVPYGYPPSSAISPAHYQQGGSAYLPAPAPVGHIPAISSSATEDDEFSDFASHSTPAVHPVSAHTSVHAHIPVVAHVALPEDDFGPMSMAQEVPEEIETGPQWVPGFEDKEIIDAWFADLDTDHKGKVGGLAIATFLKKSNLPKESLRTIWSLVDSKNKGSVNLHQFTNIIRLVSISCSPIYMGSAPNMERFEKTLKDTIRLPLALLEDAKKKAVEMNATSESHSAKVQFAQVDMHSGQSVLPLPEPVVVVPGVASVTSAPISMETSEAALADESTQQSGAVQWVPPPIEQSIIDRWWSTELDSEGKGTVGGLPIAVFLKRSNLPKEALRDIWSLIDTAHAGAVNKDQFVNMMRLVSIQCSPAYYMHAPSLERLAQTLGEYIPLPLALVHDSTAPVAGSTEAGPSPLPPLHPGAIAPPMPPVPSGIQRGTSISTMSDLSGDGVDEGQSVKFDTADIQWTPGREEAEVIDRWFAELDQERRGLLGGLAVAMFLKRSNLPKETLRSIWSLIDSRNQGSVNRGQFINMVRLVSIQCSAPYHASPPSLELLETTLSENIRLPQALFDTQDEITYGGPVPPVAPVSSTESVVSEPVSIQAPAISQWLPVDSDKALVDGWFAELDVHNNGKVGGMAIATFLKKSNLPKESLRTIWSLIDSQNQGSVDKDQFTNIIRLVSISCSAIYMGLPPTLERFEKTIKDYIALPFALTDAALVAQMSSTPAVTSVSVAEPAASSVDEDEMGEFSSHVGPSDSIADKSVPAGASGPANRLSVFDDLVENDLKAMDEDWEDFTEGASSPVPSTTPMPSEPVVMPVFETTFNDEIVFEDVRAPSPGLIAESEAAPASVANMGDVDTLGTVSATVSTFGDPFDSLEPSVEPIVVEPAVVEASSVKEDETDLSISVSVSSAVPPVSAYIDPFDHFAALESSPQPQSSSSVPPESEIVVDTTEIPAEFAPVTPVSPVSAVSARVHVDPFQFDDDGPQDAALPPMGSLSHKDTTEAAPVESNSAFAADDDEFGTFDQSDAAPTPGIQLSVAPINAVSSVISALPPSGSQTNASAFDDFEEEEGDDFGDFETHTPVPAMSQQVSELSLFEYNDPPSAPIVSSKSEVSLFDAPEDQPDTFLQDAFPATSLTPVPTEPDLLDFLSEPVAHSSYAGQTPSSAEPEDFADFGDFNDAFSSENSPAPVQTGSFFPAPVTHAPAEDLFAAPDVATASPAVKAVEPVIVSPPPAPIASPAQIQDAKLLHRKPLKYKELEALVVTLHKKNLHEQAYNCNEQAKLMRNIHDLTLQKAQAVEDDDLETAMILKKDIGRLALQAQGIDQEAAWEEDANSNRRGDSLQEVADLISLVDDVMGGKFKRKFLSSVPASSAPLDVQLKYIITAKRYARMTIAICSTHDQYPKQWLQVLQVAVGKVKEGNDIVARFKKMNHADQTALISHLKMSEYALGLLAISEIGLWVSASCIEAMVHEKIAEEVFAVCQDLLVEVDQLWGMGSRFKSMTLETLTLEAARLAEHNNVQYCNFTLRPMSFETCKAEAGKLKTSSVKLYDNPLAIDKAYFMEVSRSV